jgi:hypothetical protein
VVEGRGSALSHDRVLPLMISRIRSSVEVRASTRQAEKASASAAASLRPRPGPAFSEQQAKDEQLQPDKPARIERLYEALKADLAGQFDTEGVDVAAALAKK